MQAFAPRLQRRGEDTRDLSGDGLELAYRLETLADAACGVSAEPMDRAILLIGRRNGVAPSS
jgi:hypothetical protein